MNEPTDIYETRVDALLAATLTHERGDVDLDALTSRVLQETTQRTAPAMQRAASRQGRTRVVGVLAAATLVAVAIVVAAALVPDRLGRASHGVAGPRSAAATELLAAGASAGDAPWSPLTTGQYAYVHTLNYQTPVQHTDGDMMKTRITPNFSGPWLVFSNETWIGPDFRAYYVEANESRVHEKGAAAPVENPAARSFLRREWTADQRGPTARYGVSTRGRFVQEGLVKERSTDTYDASIDGLMIKSWSATLADINALPSGGTALDKAIARLISEAAANHPTMQSIDQLYGGLTLDRLSSEAQVMAAAQMLGAAPLSPAARRATFEWLAHAPGARLEGTTADHLGRRGTTVTFHDEFDYDLPERTVTDRELLDALRTAGATEAEVADVYVSGRTFRVAPTKSDRTWSLTVIFDRETGELLQTTMQGEQHRGSLPRLGTDWNADHTRMVHTFTYERPPAGQPNLGSSVAFGDQSTVYVDRDVTTDAVSREPACITHSDAC